MPWCSSIFMPRRKEGTRASTRSRRVSFLEGSRHQEVEDGTQVGVLGASNLGVALFPGPRHPQHSVIARDGLTRATIRL